VLSDEERSVEFSFEKLFPVYVKGGELCSDPSFTAHKKEWLD
jgi:hypothetical protein